MSPASTSPLSPAVLSDATPESADASLPEKSRPSGAVPRWSSRTLLAGRQEIEIDHDGAVYRLRQTSLGKLILTK